MRESRNSVLFTSFPHPPSLSSGKEVIRVFLSFPKFSKIGFHVFGVFRSTFRLQLWIGERNVASVTSSLFLYSGVESRFMHLPVLLTGAAYERRDSHLPACCMEFMRVVFHLFCSSCHGCTWTFYGVPDDYLCLSDAICPFQANPFRKSCLLLWCLLMLSLSSGWQGVMLTRHHPHLRPYRRCWLS